MSKIACFWFSMKHAFLTGWYRAKYEKYHNPNDKTLSEVHEGLSDAFAATAQRYSRVNIYQIMAECDCTQQSICVAANCCVAEHKDTIHE